MDRSEEWLKQIGKLVQPAQMVAAALISGLLTFAAIAVFIRGGAMLAAPGVFAQVAALFAIVAVIVSVIVGPVIDRIARRRIPMGEASNENDWMVATGELAQAFQVRTVVTFALLEGAAFFNLIVVLIDGGLLPLSFAAILVMLMVARFPTRLKFVSWLESQVRTAKEEHAVGR